MVDARWGHHLASPAARLGGAEAEVFDVAASAGTVYLMAPNKQLGVTVERSPVGSDHWQVASTPSLGSPAGGGLQSGSFVVRGSSGWLVEGNDRGTTGSATLSSTGTWVRWTPPCESVGHSFAIPAASSGQDLVAVCTMGGFAYPLSRAAPPGATLGSNWLYGSSDGGRTFTAGPELRPSRDFYDDGVLATPVAGTILMGRTEGSRNELVASFDGGASWTVVERNQPVAVAFTSATQGVGLVQSSNGTTSMIVTSDGGRRWTPVVF